MYTAIFCIFPGVQAPKFVGMVRVRAHPVMDWRIIKRRFHRGRPAGPVTGPGIPPAFYAAIAASGEHIPGRLALLPATTPCTGVGCAWERSGNRKGSLSTDNGWRVCGKPPFRVGISRAVRPGENRVEMEVVNLRVNRLIGDAGLAPGKSRRRRPEPL